MRDLQILVLSCAVLSGAVLTGCSALPPAVPAPNATAGAWSTVENVSIPFERRQEAPPLRPEGEYRNAIRPYLFAAGLKGDVTARGFQAEVDESFGDILDSLDLGFMLAYERRFDGWSLLVDSLYTKLEADAEVASVDIDSTMKMAYLELSGAVPVCEANSVDAIVGVRAWYSSIDLDIGAFGREKSTQWADPLVGLRWATPLCERWSLHLRGDVGGFGIGSASDRTWQAQAIAAYALSERTSLALGYRYLSVERDKGSGADQTDTDLALQGLLVGLDYRF